MESSTLQAAACVDLLLNGCVVLQALQESQGDAKQEVGFGVDQMVKCNQTAALVWMGRPG